MGLKSNNLNSFVSFLEKKDLNISEKIHLLEVENNIERFIYYFARMFNPDLVMVYFLVIFITSSYNNSNYLFILKPIIHTVGLLTISLALKKILKRPRPEVKDNIKRLINLRQHEKHFSMPSGDSIQAGNFAIILYMYFNSYIGFTLIPFVMFARIYYFCHYIADTVIGALLGLIFSSLIFYIIN